MNAKQIFIIVIVVLVLIILIQNTQIVTLNFFFWEISTSRIILIPFIFVLGFVTGFLVDYRIQKKKKKQSR